MIKKILISSILVSSLFVNSVFATTGKVTGNIVRIREKADVKSPEVSVATKNETVEIIGEEGNWYKVNFEKVTGYISKDYVEANYSPSNNTNTSAQENTSNLTAQNQEVSNNTSNTTNPENTVTTNNIDNTDNSNNENKTDNVDNTTSSEENNKEENQENTQDTSTNVPNYEKNQTVTFEEETDLKFLPSFTSRVSEKTSKNSTYTIELILNNWVKVSDGSTSGWVLKTSINGTDNNSSSENNSSESGETTDKPAETENQNQPDVSSEQKPETETVKKGTVNVPSAKIRKEPDGTPLSAIKEGTEVTILGEENDWYHISVGEYDSCYIAKRLITEK